MRIQAVLDKPSAPRRAEPPIAQRVTASRRRTAAAIALSLAFVAGRGEAWADEQEASANPNDGLSCESCEGAKFHGGSAWPTVAPRNKHPWLTTFELGAGILLGTAWYWVDRERQVADWDYPGWKAKLTFDRDIFIFDNNPFMVNYSWHPFAGGAMQVIGRANGLGVYEAAGLGTLASIVWEYGIESRELISINDLLVTNSTGIAVGEFFHRAAQYAQGQGDSWLWQAYRHTLGLPHTVHDFWDSELLHPKQPVHPRFRVYAGLGVASVERQDGAGTPVRSEDNTLTSIGVDGSLVALGNYMKPGLRTGFFYKANFSDFRMRITRPQHSGMDVYADTTLAGWRRQDIPETPGSGVGSTLNIGTSIGYRYHREDFGIWQDRLGGLHMPGLAVDGELFASGLTLRMRTRAHLDLMGVNSLSTNRWNAAHQNQETNELGKSILANSGYYYGFGASLMAELSLEWKYLQAGADLFAASYKSIEGYDRLRDELAYEISGEDSFLDYAAWLRISPYQALYAELRYSAHERAGSLAEFDAEQSMRRFGVDVGMRW